MSNKYNLKWNSHHAEAFGNFDLLRNREMLVDITLSCGGQTLKAHRLVLCTGSAFFEKLLQRDNSSSPIVHFHGIDMMHLRLLVDFMYLGEVDVPSSELEEFIALADSLEVKGLKGEKSKKFDSSGPSGRPELPPAFTRPQMTSAVPFTNVRPLGTPLKSSTATSSYPTPGKRRLLAGVDSASVVHDARPSLSALPTPEKRAKPETIVPDNQALGRDESHSGTTASVKTEEEDDIEEVEAVEEDNHQPFWAEEEGLPTAEGDNSQSSYRTEGEEFDPNEIPTNIPPEIAPETVTRGYDGVGSGISKKTKCKIHFCTFCSYRSPYRTSTLRHVQSRHTGERPYECDLCGRKFLQRQTLNYHMASNHSVPFPGDH